MLRGQPSEQHHYFLLFLGDSHNVLHLLYTAYLEIFLQILESCKVVMHTLICHHAKINPLLSHSHHIIGLEHDVVSESLPSGNIY